MSIITKVLKQTAVYWEPSGIDKYGQATVSLPIELSVRWEDMLTEVLNSDGTKQLSKAKVMVSSDVEIGGFLKLGTLESCLDIVDPSNNESVFEIISFEKMPNIRNTEFFRQAYL